MYGKQDGERDARRILNMLNGYGVAGELHVTRDVAMLILLREKITESSPSNVRTLKESISAFCGKFRAATGRERIEIEHSLTQILIPSLQMPSATSAGSPLGSSESSATDRQETGCFPTITDAIQVLSDNRQSSQLRFNAARFLGRYGGTRTGKPEQRTRTAWWQFWRAPSRQEPTATSIIEHLRLALKDSDWMVRWGAVLALGDMMAGESVPDLIGLLADPDETVVQGVKQVLERIGTQAALDALASHPTLP